MTASDVLPAGTTVFGTRASGFPSIDDLLRQHRDQAAAPRISIATAYWDGSIIQRAGDLADGSERAVRLLLWLDGGSRAALTNFRASADRIDVDTRFVGSPGATGIFHVKLYGLHDGDAAWQRALVGSPNFTDAAMRSNLELAVLLDQPEEVAKLQAWFDRQFDAAIPAEKLDWEAALERLPDNPPGERRRAAQPGSPDVAPDALADAPRPRTRVGGGARQLDLLDILEAASGLAVRAEDGGAVLELDTQIGTESLKRTRLDRDDQALYLRFWPAELRDQADAFYNTERATRVLDAGTSETWSCRPLPNLAYWNAPPQNRQYFEFDGTLERYIDIWHTHPSATTGAKSPKFELERWPHLVQIGAFPDTRGAREQMQKVVDHPNRGDRVIQIRPTVEMVRRIDAEGGSEVSAVRAALEEALEILQEPALPPVPLDGTPPNDNTWVCVVGAKHAYPVWQHAGLYWCQPHRTFSTPLTRIGFYHDKAIEPELPLMLQRISATSIAELERSDAPDVRALATRIAGAVAAGLPGPEEPFDLYEFTTASDPRTIKLKQRVRHHTTGRGTGFTQSQRYVELDKLLAGPTTTNELN